MLTFIPLCANGEPVVRPPKKGELFLETDVDFSDEVSVAMFDFVAAHPIYLAVDYAERLAAERALVEACESFTVAMRHGEKPDYLLLVEALHEADAALAKARGEA